MNRQSPGSLREALAFVASHIETALPPRRVALSSAFGHVLAEDLRAPVSLPRFDNAAMDGFALCSDDLGPDGCARLKVAHKIAAGQTELAELRRGEAAQITTGAPLPPGADRVVVQEAARVLGNEVHLTALPGGKPHIRRVGEDVRSGSVILKAGMRIGPGQIALLTALGFRSVLVVPRPKVGLLSTGDELLESPAPRETGRIYDSNRPMLVGMLQAAGAEVTDLGIAPDDPDAIIARLVAAAGTHDLLISSGGASVGFADHLCQIVSRRGFLEFWKLAMRPGKPIGFGDIDDCPILLLPGNPLAAATGLALIGRAILARLEGRSPADGAHLRLPLASPLTKPACRTEIHLGRFDHDPHSGATVIEPLPNLGSASLRYLALADVMIVLHPDQTNIGAGEPVEVVPVWR